MTFAFIITFLLVAGISGRYLSTDELTFLLMINHVGIADIMVWKCIASKESDMNTAYWDHETEEMGIFAIADVSCMKNKDMSHELSCDLTCEDLRDDEIEDDITCALKLFDLYKEMTGDGFSYWPVYVEGYCKAAVDYDE